MPKTIHSNQRAETTVAECSLTSCMRAHFQLGFHSLGSGVVSPLQLHWVMGVCVWMQPATCTFGRMTGSFMCHCGNTGVEQTPNKSRRTKWRRRVSCHSCRDSNLQPFHHESGDSNLQPFYHESGDSNLQPFHHEFGDLPASCPRLLAWKQTDNAQ